MPDTPDQILWAGRFLRIIQRGHWEFVQRCNASGVVGIIAVTPDRRLILVQQPRIPLGASTLELPAGLAGDIAGQEHEAIERAARRELLEETGYAGGVWQELFGGPSSAGLTDESLTLFLAEGVEKSGPGGGDSTEQIHVQVVPLTELDDFLLAQQQQGVHIDLKVRLALYYLNLRYRQSTSG